MAFDGVDEVECFVLTLVFVLFLLMIALQYCVAVCYVFGDWTDVS